MYNTLSNFYLSQPVSIDRNPAQYELPIDSNFLLLGIYIFLGSCSHILSKLNTSMTQVITHTMVEQFTVPVVTTVSNVMSLSPSLPNNDLNTMMLEMLTRERTMFLYSKHQNPYHSTYYYGNDPGSGDGIGSKKMLEEKIAIRKIQLARMYR